MLKITEQRSAQPDSVSLLLEGRLAGPWVEELHVYCRTMSGDEQQGTTIDLTGVTFIDAGGKGLLIRLWNQGAELHATGCLTRCIVEEITGVSRVDRRMEKDESA